MAHGAQAFRNSAQSIPNAAQTALSFSQVNFDTDTFWAVGSPTRLTIPVGLGGQYVVTAEIAWGSNVTGDREILLKKNGATFFGDLLQGAGAGGACNQVCTVIALFAAGDFIEMFVNQTSGGALNATSTSPLTPTFSLSFMGS